MRFRQLTAAGDWTFGKGKAGYAINETAIELNIRTRLQSWKGDCFWALNDHVDWLSRLDKNQAANLKRELQNVLLQSFGVVAIDRFEGAFDPTFRRYTATFHIRTIFGDSFVNQLDLAAGLPIGS